MDAVGNIIVMNSAIAASAKLRYPWPEAKAEPETQEDILSGLFGHRIRPEDIQDIRTLAERIIKRAVEEARR